ncbi:MAG: arginine repressor [Christensenellales bacterium]|jgi:transcriptional regulator of arginine metabolism
MKTARHAMVLDIISKYDIETQDELAEYLRQNGFDVTQATVSRDIKELRLIKVLGEEGGYKYATVDKAESGLVDRFMRMFAHSVISITSTGTLVVLKTLSGSANAAAEAVDSLRWPEILGSIAGDNTIFVAVRSEADVPQVVEKFRSMMK